MISDPVRRVLWALLPIALAGLAVRLVLAFAFVGNGDLFGFEVVAMHLREGPFHAYSAPLPWVYPPAYLAWTTTVTYLREFTGLPFHGLVQLLPILADLALASLVWVYLGWKERSDRFRLAAFALVMLGPVFIAISGYHGQIDAVAILPAVIGFMIWERSEHRYRAIWVGLLLGLGAATKTVPLLLVLPLLVTVRSRQEAVMLLAPAVAVPFLISLPFFLTDPHAFQNASGYAGVPGRGGLSLLADPSFAAGRLQSIDGAFYTSPNAIVGAMTDLATYWTLLLMAGYAWFLYRFRPSPLDGVVLLWLVIYCFSPNFLLQYLVWSIPFFLMSGYLRQVTALQIAMIPTLLVVYVDALNTPAPFAWMYVAIMACLWVAWIVCFVRLTGRILDSRRRHPAGVLPPLASRRPA